MTLNAKIKSFMDFLAIFACESLYHSQGGATPLTSHAWPMCIIPDGPSPNDVRFLKL